MFGLVKFHTAVLIANLGHTIIYHHCQFLLGAKDTKLILRAF